jgi:hypothetical protein
MISLRVKSLNQLLTGFECFVVDMVGARHATIQIIIFHYKERRQWVFLLGWHKEIQGRNKDDEDENGVSGMTLPNAGHGE